MRIVVVEDEAPIRNGMSKILKKIDESYELVGTAENGKQGLELILKTVPDLVIMDICMPDMDGLTMLAKARQQGANCKVIVLSAYSDFVYAKMAIELGIENYLLKPLKIPELKRALKQVEEDMMAKQSKEQFFTLDSIFYRSATGQFICDEQTDMFLKNQYGIRREEELALLAVRFTKEYDLYHDTIKELLEDVDIHETTFHSIVMEFPGQNSVIMLLYRMQDKEQLYQYLRKSVVPMLAGQTRGKVICSYVEAKGFADVYPALKGAKEAMSWNLVLKSGGMISAREIERMQITPVKYPMEVENQAKQAVMHGSEKEFASCAKQFAEECLAAPHDPRQIKEACARYVMALLHAVKEYNKLSGDLSIQDIMNQITKAFTWGEIEDAFHEFFDRISFQEEDNSTSLMVKRARQMIQEYYNQGITLDEIARKLCVSEEYLSAQFRKETGKTFSETIRGYRIDKVKKLLLESTLKLNQIADMAGYADPKYMSKVFREEVGVTPAEYRKMNL